MRWTLSRKLILLTALPLAMVLYFAVSDLAARWAHLQEHRSLLRLAEVVSSLEELTHQHALERGLSAGFLGSQGARLGSELRQQRQQSDAAEQALQQLRNAREDKMSLLAQQALDDVMEGLRRKAEIRSAVDGLRGNGVFAYYSDLNERALDAQDLLQMEVSDQDIRRQLQLRLFLGWIKERAGQERGAVNGVLAAGKATGAQFASIENYIHEQERLERMLAQLADSTFLERYRAATGDSSLSGFYDTRRRLQQQEAQLDAIQGPTPAIWFEVASLRIAALAGLVRDLDGQMRMELQAETAAARTELWAETIGLLLVLALVAWTTRWIGAGILHRVERVESALLRAEKDGHLNQTLEDDSHDEISIIARSLNRFFASIAGIIGHIVRVTLGLNQRAQEFRQLTGANLEALHRQQLDTQQIASAITEMAASIQEVARSAQASTSLTQLAGESTRTGQDKANATHNAVTQLTRELENASRQVGEVAQQSQKIGGILDTIRGIAEQTNLLALNAAIEAARAGEQGRGFAVVADEVRSLAQRTQESTAEIQRMIQQLQTGSDAVRSSMDTSRQHAERCNELAEESGAVLGQIGTLVHQVVEHMNQIAVAAQEQSTVATQIDQNTQQIAHSADTSLKSAEQVQKGSIQIQEQAAELQQLVVRFDVAR